MPCTLSQLTLTSSCCPVAQLPSCQAANQLTEVTNCKLRQLCYDSFRNQQLSSRGKSSRWGGGGREREGRAASRLQFINDCGCRRRAQTLLSLPLSHSRSLSLQIRILLSQQPRIVGLKQKAMQSECTHLMFALTFAVTVAVAVAVHSDVALVVWPDNDTIPAQGNGQ